MPKHRIANPKNHQRVAPKYNRKANAMDALALVLIIILASLTGYIAVHVAASVAVIW